MHCDKCNVDFPEGLRYCKWCGESLVDRARVTSELHSCPSCAAVVQPSWAYCKTCGEPLRAGARHPVGAVCPRCGAATDPGAPRCLRCSADLTEARPPDLPREASDTSLISTCSSCGERLDTGSLYCKACGSAAYTQQKPFGGSALLCAACNSYSPLGSRVCRVCGAPLAGAPQTVADRPIPAPPIPQKPNAPGLDQHALTEEMAAGIELSAGANTLAFTPERASTSRTKRTVETSGLPGTAGSKSEQQAPTSVMHMGRTTGAVEGELPEPASGGLEGEPSHHADVESLPKVHEERRETSEATVEFVAPTQGETPEASTSGLGSESAMPRGDSESATQVFVSPSHAPSGPRRQISQEDVRTREFISPQPGQMDATGEFQLPGTNFTADGVRATGQIASVTEQAGAAAIGFDATRDVGSVTPLDVQADSQPLPKKRTFVVIVSVVVAAIVIGAAAFVFWWSVFARGRPAPPVVAQQPPVASEPVAPPPAENPPVPAVPEGMVPVAAGTYTIGRDKADPLEQPQHKVDLPAFFIDRTEVTNAAYKKFVDATGHKPPTNWSDGNYGEGRDNFSVTGVTWQDAADFATWAGKRLPTEAEWEAAARGVDGRIYPWGNDWRSGVANIGLRPDLDITADQYPSAIKEVGQYALGASPVGAVDMIGNAWEWVADEIKLYPGNTESKLSLQPGVTYRVIRGGAYDGNKVHDATYRGYLDASLPYPKVGFRCAKDAK